MKGRCLHRAKGVCPSCRRFETLMKARLPTVRKGDRPWTQTFGELSREAERAPSFASDGAQFVRHAPKREGDRSIGHGHKA